VSDLAALPQTLRNAADLPVIAALPSSLPLTPLTPALQPTLAPSSPPARRLSSPTPTTRTPLVIDLLDASAPNATGEHPQALGAPEPLALSGGIAGIAGIEAAMRTLDDDGPRATADALADHETNATSLPEAYDYCRRIIQQIARTFYYGSLFLPEQKRRAAWALYAFCRVADDIADEPDLYPEPLSALAHWRADLLGAYDGKPRGPVMRAWADALTRWPVPLQPALDLLDGVEMDVRGGAYATFEDLRLYCYRVAGTVGLLTAPILGYDDAHAPEAAVDLGIAMQLTNILRDIGEDRARGRIYLPADEMAAFGYGRDELERGVVNAAFINLIEFQIARAETYYERGMAGIALLHPDARLAITLSGELYRAILYRIRRNHYDVFTQRAHIPLTGKLAILPRAWLRVRSLGKS
jgi:phytoene synthase